MVLACYFVAGFWLSRLVCVCVYGGLLGGVGFCGLVGCCWAVLSCCLTGGFLTSLTFCWLVVYGCWLVGCWRGIIWFWWILLVFLWWCFVALFTWGEFLVFDSCWLCNIDSGSYMVVCAVLECVDCLCR